MILALLCIAAYLLGSIPFGLLLTKAAGLGDIRATGSGNIGATNVLRTGNKKIAAATLLLDALKGTAAVLLAMQFYAPLTNHAQKLVPDMPVYYVALAAMLGHIYPVWLKFKGGKGVATYMGVLLALSPLAFAVTVTQWVGIFYARRISSFAALTAVLFAPFWLFIFNDTTSAVFGGLLAALIFYTHRANIARLMNGTEPRFGKTS